MLNISVAITNKPTDVGFCIGRYDRRHDFDSNRKQVRIEF